MVALSQNGAGTRVARLAACMIGMLMLLATVTAAPAWAKSRTEFELARNAMPKPVQGATLHANVPYLPKSRWLGDARLHKDHQLLMDIYVPKDGKKSHPCVVYVHGGGYGGGDKTNLPGEFTEEMVNAGFVVCSVNYVLKPRTVFPQAIYDLRDSIRFLRINADRYQVDPCAIGALGISAGGWLISGMEYPRSDWVMRRIGAATHLTDERWNWQLRRRKPLPMERLATRIWHPVMNPDPAYPDTAGCLQAVCLDFAKLGEQVQEVREIPFINKLAGSGKKGEPHLSTEAFRTSLRQKLGPDFDISYSQLAEEKYWGKGVHAPSFKSQAWLVDGKEKGPLSVRVRQFFVRSLITERTTPKPELRIEALRSNKPVKVRVVTAAPQITVHYTTDGSEPTVDSPRYTEPLQLAPGATIKARGFLKGYRHSVVVTAKIAKGSRPVQITSPLDVDLPDGQVGKPYKLVFKSDVDGSYWMACGDLGWRGNDMTFQQREPRPDQYTVNGLVLDPKTGILSGVPQYPGRFWLQVQVASKAGELGTLRNYRLVITGRGDEPIPRRPTLEDPNVVLCRLPDSVKEEDVKAFAGDLQKKSGRISSVIAEKSGDTWLILVPYYEVHDGLKHARPIVESKRWKNVEWAEPANQGAR